MSMPGADRGKPADFLAMEVTVNCRMAWLLPQLSEIRLTSSVGSVTFVYKSFRIFTQRETMSTDYMEKLDHL